MRPTTYEYVASTASKIEMKRLRAEAYPSAFNAPTDGVCDRGEETEVSRRSGGHERRSEVVLRHHTRR